MTEILTPDSDCWGSFTEALGHAVQANGCDCGYLRMRNFYPCGPLKATDAHRLAKRTMAAMGDVDVPGSIAYFEAHGGHCDCEILMNVDPS